MNHNSLDVLLRWVIEREIIRVRKERGDEPPWTEDPILSEWHFCNVRREDDRVTRWIKVNIRDRFAGHEHLWFMLCAARMVNWPPTLAALIDGDGPYFGAWPSHSTFAPENMGEALDDLKSMGLKVFTGAYIIPAPTVAGVSKGRYVAETVLGSLWHHPDTIRSVLRHGHGSMRGVHDWLTHHRGWGPFLAYQAVVDMRFTDLLRNAPDVSDWCACGPGTVRGLNRLHGRSVKEPAHVTNLAEVRKLFPLIKAETGVEIDFSDVPNILCETDKFLRVRNGEGTPRARYIPGRGC